MFKKFDEEGEALILKRMADPDLIRTDGIMRSLRSSDPEPIFEQGILRKLKMSSIDEFEERSMLNNGIMRSLKRSVWPLRNVHTNGLLRSIRSVENGEDDEQRSYFMEDKQANFNRGL